jgi:hypothetical protein
MAHAPKENAMSIRHTLPAALVFTSLACGHSEPRLHAEPGMADALHAFSAAAGELPEGLAVHGDDAYVGFAPLGQIARVDLASGEQEPFAKLPTPVPNKGFMTGLAIAPNEALVAGLASFDASVQPGIYRVGPDGGAAELFAQHAQLAFPNGLVFDADGSLFVTESAGGIVFKISAGGEATVWAESPLLTGDPSACGGSGNPFPIGANGIVRRDDAFFVTNTDRGSIVRIPVQRDGAAGTPELLVSPDCDALAGADGLTLDGQDNFIVAVNRQNKIVRISADGDVHALVSGAPADFPASLAWDHERLVATNFALANASSGQPARPGLLVLPDAF